ncbi:MAG: helix-turn-helix domain-containing protein [Thermodesulfobacteriota bacterium]
MDRFLLAEIRHYLGKTQAEMAHLLGTSLKAVQSFEQGWRRIPPHAERQALFFLSRKTSKGNTPCWDIMGCPEQRKSKCPAREFKSGDMCWFINGTMCQGQANRTWQEKMQRCRSCKVFGSIFPEGFKYAPVVQEAEPPCP